MEPHVRAYKNKYRADHKDHINTLNKGYQHDRKKEVFDLLGNKCANPNCLVPDGCKDVRCLQIDHINGGGKKELESTNRYSYYVMVQKKIKEGSKDYQLLCVNCNWIKRTERSIHHFDEI
jgi:hypothetical protein